MIECGVYSNSLLIILDIAGDFLKTTISISGKFVRRAVHDISR